MLPIKLGIRAKLKAVEREAKYWWENTINKPKLFDLSSKERLGVIFHEPSDMCVSDRVMLYALVRGLKPLRALEIGVRWGGSARIITNAMQENGIGQLMGIDPYPEAFRASDKELHQRYKLVRGYSPDKTADAVEYLGGKVDFVLIDGLHTHDAVLADLRGVLPHLSIGSHILLHDTYHAGINQAVERVLQEVPEMKDCGFVTRNPMLTEVVAYQGLRLLQYGTIDAKALIASAYLEANYSEPDLSERTWNYDPWLMRMQEQARAQGKEIDNKGREIQPSV